MDYPQIMELEVVVVYNKYVYSLSSKSSAERDRLYQRSDHLGSVYYVLLPVASLIQPSRL